MLEREIMLLETRIPRANHPDKMFFAYANTVATIDFAKKYKGHGWMGRYQIAPEQPFNEILLHLRFHQTEARFQQEAVGFMGVNLVYGAFYNHDEPKKIIKHLTTILTKLQLKLIPLIFLDPFLMEVDNRLLSLLLLKNDMTDAVMFNPKGNNILPARVLYKKNILVLRGKF